MVRSQLLRSSARAVRTATIPSTARRVPLATSSRLLSTTAIRCDDKKEGGSFARTDDSIQVEYPKEGQLPPSVPVQGRGGQHFKRTLASFSLEGKVGVITGGARGLGLVMTQAMVISGADVAIVDLNSMCCPSMH
jgi:D-arabinitol 2-dehydrogenase